MTSLDPNSPSEDSRGQAANALDALARGEAAAQPGGADPLAETLAASPADEPPPADLADAPADLAQFAPSDSNAIARVRRQNVAQQRQFALSFRRFALPLMGAMALMMVVIAGLAIVWAGTGRLHGASATAAWVIAACCLGVGLTMVIGAFAFWRDIQQADAAKDRPRRP